MTQFVFGSGTLIGKTVGVLTPSVLGVLQEVSIDFDRKVETLLGQYNFAVAIGGAELKISGKAKAARLQSNVLNNIFLGQTLTTSGGIEMSVNEINTVTAGAVTVTNGATFVEDLGVFASNGTQLKPVTVSPAAGVSYVPGAVGVGTYSFATGDDATAYSFFYSYTIATGSQIAIAQQLMGPVPTFELNLKETFTFNGVVRDFVVKLNSCFSPKLSLPFTNAKFAIQEFDFQAIADAFGNVGTIAMPE